RAATLARVLAAIDRFSIRHISPHILSDKLQFVVSSKVGAIRSQRQTKVCRTPSLARTFAASQLFGLRNLIRDRSQLFCTGRQLFKYLLPVAHSLLIIACLKGGAAREVERFLI